MKRTFVFAAMLLVCSLVSAEVVFRPDHPDRYVVKEGDTLWGIASLFLEDPWLWPEIWDVNPQVENPHLIYPGDIILLRYVNGSKRIVVVAPGEEPPPPEESTRLEKQIEIPVEPPPPQRTVEKQERLPTDIEQPQSTGAIVRTRSGDKLVPRIRVTPLKPPIPAIPLDAIAGLLVTGRVVEKSDINNAPYIVAGYDKNLVFGPGNLIYVMGDEDDWEMTAEVHGVYKTSEEYRDPLTNKLLGTEAREAGLARFKRYVDDLATFDLISVNEDVRIGDLLLPTEERRLESTFFPRAPTEDIRGAIMKPLGGLSGIGTYSAIAINVGEEHGLEPGHVLEVYRRGRIVDDPNSWFDIKLPSERTGLVMVYRTFEEMSYAIVLQAKDYMTIGDPLVTP